MAKSAPPLHDDTEQQDGASSGESKGGLAGFFAKLPFAAIGKSISGLFSTVRDKIGGENGLGAAVKNIRESSRGRLFALIGLVVILLIIVVILIASLASSITGAQIREEVKIQTQPRERMPGAPGSDVSRSGESQQAAVTQAARIPWLERPILPNEHDFFLKGEWGTDRVPQEYWDLHDLLVRWQKLEPMYVKQLREYNSERFRAALEADK